MPFDSPDLGFRDRLAYLRWLRNRGRLRPETDAQVAAYLGVTTGWVEKWKQKHNSPPGHKERIAMTPPLEAMGTTDDWLYEGEGSPPQPRLWKGWFTDWEHARALEALPAGVGKRKRKASANIADAEDDREEGSG